MRVDNFPGLITDQDSMDIGLEGFVTVENVDLSKKGKPSRREGYSVFYAGTIDAAWADEDIFLFVEGGYLKSLQADGTATTIATLSADSKFLTGERAFDNRVYWSTGLDDGVIEQGVNRPFGVRKPASLSVEAGAGSMPEARYLIGLAYVDANGVEGPLSYATGEMSGSVTVTIPDTISTLLADGITRVRLFVSFPDGEVLYRADEIDVGDALYLTYAGDTTDLGVPAEAADLDNMPTDGLLVEHGGRIWRTTRGAEGGMLVYSEPYSELTNLRTNFFAYPKEITGLGSIGAGLYVGTTDAVYFLNGDDPERMTSSKKLNYGMIPGTVVLADGRRIGEGTNARVLLWASERGVCMGAAGRYGDGEVTNLSEARVGTMTGHAGTAILRRANGQNHFLTVLRS